MTNTLHIERRNADGRSTPICLKEWSHAVERTDGIRLATGDAVASIPVTEGTVVLPNRGGDAEIFRQDCDTWLRAMFWTPEGRIRFAAPTMKDDPIIALAETLASKLEARVTDTGDR